eukprot:6173468-Pleurochrysis_carterae.AAC.1
MAISRPSSCRRQRYSSSRTACGYGRLPRFAVVMKMLSYVILATRRIVEYAYPATCCTSMLYEKDNQAPRAQLQYGSIRKIKHQALIMICGTMSAGLVARQRGTT